jgi:acetyl-CoA C-acetyltransferase
MGDTELVDAMVHDGLWDAFDDAHMGGLSDEVNRRLGIDRAAQDEWSARSHERAAEATKNGVLAEEIAPVVDRPAQGRGHRRRGRGHPPRHHRRGPGPAAAGVLARGHHHRRQRLPDLGRGGAVVVTSRERAAAEACRCSPRWWPTGRGRARHQPPLPAVAGHRRRLPAGRGRPGRPGPGRDQRGLRRRRPALDRELELDEAIVNVNGGAVALGHPIGASGTRVVLTLAMELRRRGAGWARPPCAAAAARATPCSSGSKVNLDELLERLKDGDKRAVARLISWVEDGDRDQLGTPPRRSTRPPGGPR